MLWKSLGNLWRPDDTKSDGDNLGQETISCLLRMAQEGFTQDQSFLHRHLPYPGQIHHAQVNNSGIALVVRTRQAFGQKYLLSLVFLAYVGLLALTISHHEPWADEAQAWLIARDVGVVELFAHVLRYEGTPGLWHLILMAPAKAGLPYWSLGVISGVIAAAGVSILLTYCKVPLLPRLMLPFSFVLLYQYAVVARSYVLLPILLFSIGAIYRDKTRRIYLFTLLLCLLADANLHGTFIALSLAAIHTAGAGREWSSMDSALREKHLIALGAFGATISLIILQVIPPADLVMPTSPCPDPTGRLVVLSSFLLADSITLPGLPWLSIPVFLASIVWFWRQKALWEYVLPTAGLLLLFGLVYFSPWHECVLFLVWVFAVGIGFEHQRLGNCRGGDRLRRLDELFPGVVVLVAGIQIIWAAPMIKWDLRQSYTGSTEAAHYIKDHNLQDKTIYATGFHSIAILPYFKDNIFANLNGGKKPAFWWWSMRNPLVLDKRWGSGNLPEVVRSIRRQKPDIIVVSVTQSFQRSVLPLAGYEVAVDCGGAARWKGIRYETGSFIILRRKGAELPEQRGPSP